MTDAARMYQPLSPEEVATAEAASTSAQSRPKPVPIAPVPSTAPSLQYQHPKHGAPSKAWPYHNAGGQVVGYVCRWDFTNSDGEPDKAILPVCYCDLGDGRRAWRSVGMPTPRPLLRLLEILKRPDTRVLICEGEKAADAAANLFPNLMVTTPPHGSKSPRKADWTPLKGREVVVWPDNDKSGSEFAEAVARLCTDSGAASVAIVAVPPDFPLGWDLADPPPESWDDSDLRELLVTAKEPPLAHEAAESQAEKHRAGHRHRQAKSLSVLGFPDLLRLDVPERVRLLPWLPEGGLVMVHAPRGLGKTWLVIGLIMALMIGGEFLRWKVKKPAGVLFIDGEMDLSELRDRIVSLHPEQPTAPLEVLSHQHVFDREQADMNFGETAWQDRLKAHLETHPELRVVIFDNISCLFPTTPENKRDDWARDVLPFLIWMRRRGIAAVLIHHSGKSGQQRGTSAREDQLDTTIRLDPLPEDDQSVGARFLVTFTKNRGAWGEEVEPIIAELIEQPDGSLIWTWQRAEQSNETRLYDLVRETDGNLTIREAAEHLGISATMVHKIKQRLVKKGMLKSGRRLEVADG